MCGVASIASVWLGVGAAVEQAARSGVRLRQSKRDAAGGVPQVEGAEVRLQLRQPALGFDGAGAAGGDHVVVLTRCGLHAAEPGVDQ